MKRIVVDELELAVLDEGSGPPILLVHGFPLDHRMWREQVSALSGEFRVIAPDLRGFGQSGWRQQPCTMEQFAADLDGLLAELGVSEPVILCGLSMGGYIAFAFLREYAARVRALVLCDTRSAPDTTAGAMQRIETAKKVLAGGPDELIAGMLGKLLSLSSVNGQPQLLEDLRTMMTTAQVEAVAAALEGMAQRQDSTPMLAQIEVPTLVVVGSEDAITGPHEMRSVADAIPNAKFVAIEGAGHMAPLEHPAEVNAALLEFLRGLG